MGGDTLSEERKEKGNNEHRANSLTQYAPGRRLFRAPRLKKDGEKVGPLVSSAIFPTPPAKVLGPRSPRARASAGRAPFDADRKPWGPLGAAKAHHRRGRRPAAVSETGESAPKAGPKLLEIQWGGPGHFGWETGANQGKAGGPGITACGTNIDRRSSDGPPPVANIVRRA